MVHRQTFVGLPFVSNSPSSIWSVLMCFSGWFNETTPEFMFIGLSSNWCIAIFWCVFHVGSLKLNKSSRQMVHLKIGLLVVVLLVLKFIE